MYFPDVNILIHAFRADAPRHEVCKKWLERQCGMDGALCISKLALSAVVRITTRRGIFVNPSPLDEAFEFCRALLDLDTISIIEPGDNHWGIFERLCIENQIRGALATDAWFAALAMEWGCELVSFDRDFARFPGLKWSMPQA